MSSRYYDEPYEEYDEFEDYKEFGGKVYGYEEEDYSHECEYDNSDVWDAVTDGQYGDCPEGDFDLDWFGLG